MLLAYVPIALLVGSFFTVIHVCVCLCICICAFIYIFNEVLLMACFLLLLFQFEMFYKHYLNLHIHTHRVNCKRWKKFLCRVPSICLLEYLGISYVEKTKFRKKNCFRVDKNYKNNNNNIRRKLIKVDFFFSKKKLVHWHTINVSDAWA